MAAVRLQDVGGKDVMRKPVAYVEQIRKSDTAREPRANRKRHPQSTATQCILFLSRAILQGLVVLQNTNNVRLGWNDWLVSCGARTHAQLPAVDLKSTPLTARAN